MNVEEAKLNNIGKRIRELRESKGLSRNALADMISSQASTTMSPTTLLSIESGQGANVRTIIRIAEALQIPLQSLFELYDLSAAAGHRAFEQAIQLFGYSVERHRFELRLNHNGGAFAVNTIEKLHRDWYEGPIKIWHTINTARQQKHSRISLCEAPFEILEKPRDLPIEQERWIHDRDRDSRGFRRFQYEIGLPIGLGEGKISYRYSYSLSACFQMFAEAALIPADILKEYGEPPDIPPEELPGLVANVEKDFRRLTENQKKKLPPARASHCCNQFPAEQLIISVKFPQQCLPTRFEARCWAGGSKWSDSTENLVDRLLTKDNFLIYRDEASSQLRLEIYRPMMGISYAIFWWPPPFEQFWASYQQARLID